MHPSVREALTQLQRERTVIDVAIKSLEQMNGHSVVTPAPSRVTRRKKAERRGRPSKASQRMMQAWVTRRQRAAAARISAATQQATGETVFTPPQA